MQDNRAYGESLLFTNHHVQFELKHMLEAFVVWNEVGVLQTLSHTMTHVVNPYKWRDSFFDKVKICTQWWKTTRSCHEE
jgi:hypothetical protein